MRRLWRQLAIATNWPVLVAAAVLSAAGTISIWEQSPEKGARQLVYLGVAIVCLAAIQAVNYTSIGRYAWAFYLFSLALVFYTVAHLPGVETVNGASAWINFRVMSLEPSELMKISFVMALARYLRFRSNYRTLTGLLPPFALALFPVMLILKQPDLGMAALFIPTLLAMLFVAGARGKHIMLVIAMGAVLAPIVLLGGSNLPIFRHLPMILKPYQSARVTAMFSSDPQIMRDQGYQRERALAAMGVGGLTGKGLGNVSVSRSVPEAYDDMIFAVIGEQFGFIGSIVVLTAYVVLFAAGVEISASTREPFGKLVALGVVALLASQALLNLMVVMGLFPVTGVTLPFISYGGSSLLASYIAAGLLLNIGQNRPLVIARDAFEFR
ncbi:MAG TPA: FtsW/RodA/SpoVE family cell cycle protein [Tepidisphaeraceae bacterium]|nr:FtsW/RodA/SpoVE family cell cycle protein [Tepidisphaeraceae bacterium]